jgi:N-acetylneuraminic acid mutarotase
VRRWTPSAGVINEVLYVAGGTDQAFTPARSLYAYNPATNTWATKASMLEPLGVCPRQVSA